MSALYLDDDEDLVEQLLTIGLWLTLEAARRPDREEYARIERQAAAVRAAAARLEQLLDAGKVEPGGAPRLTLAEDDKP